MTILPKTKKVSATTSASSTSERHERVVVGPTSVVGNSVSGGPSSGGTPPNGVGGIVVPHGVAAAVAGDPGGGVGGPITPADNGIVGNPSRKRNRAEHTIIGDVRGSSGVAGDHGTLSERESLGLSPNLVVGGPSSCKRGRNGNIIATSCSLNDNSSHQRRHNYHHRHQLSNTSSSCTATSSSASAIGPRRNSPPPASHLSGATAYPGELNLDMGGGLLTMDNSRPTSGRSNRGRIVERPEESVSSDANKALLDGNNDNASALSGLPADLLPSGMVVAGEVDMNISASPPGSPTGYNSGDEYGGCPSGVSPTDRPPQQLWSPEQVLEMERRFEKVLRKKGLLISKMGEDGSCLFRAVADQVYGDEDMHALVRKLCCDYMTKNSDYFSQYVTEDFSQYVARKRRDHIQGNHIELQAMSELFARPIEVYHYNNEPINIFQSGHDDEMMMLEEMEPIRLSYHTPGVFDCGHYNSVRPLRGIHKPKATLLHFTPPHSLETALRNSEADELEKTMLEDKIRASDWEATNEALEEQVARESYLQWLRDNERRRRSTGSPNNLVGNTCSTVTSSEGSSNSASGSRSPPRGQPSPSTQWSFMGSSNLLDGPAPTAHTKTSGSRRSVSPNPRNPTSPSSYRRNHQRESDVSKDVMYYQDLPDCPEAEREILARVLMASQQEYLDNLKKTSSSSGHKNSKSTSRGSTPPPSSSKV